MIDVSVNPVTRALTASARTLIVRNDHKIEDIRFDVPEIFPAQSNWVLWDSGSENGALLLGVDNVLEVTRGLTSDGREFKCALRLVSADGEVWNSLVVKFKVTSALDVDGDAPPADDPDALGAALLAMSGYAAAAAVSAGDAEDARDAAQALVDSVTGMTADATTLAPGSSATATVALVGGVLELELGIPQGPKGDKGDQGDKGDIGEKGDTGDTGADFRLLGRYDTLPDLQTAHPTGTVGDAYAIGTPETNTIYIWSPDTTAWVDVGPLQGPQGIQGPPGATPARGTDYWTPDDIAAIKSYVDDAILGGAW